MVEPRRYKLMVATFSYGGNGGTRSEAKDLGDWTRNHHHKFMCDKRISSVVYNDISDTPITMTRNQTVLRALNANCDLLLMLDSDMKPDCEMEDDRSAKPFWDSSFDFVDMMYDKYPVVVGAPYCGRGSEENVFVFHWTNCFTNNPHEVDMQLVAYTRYHAQLMKGIQPAGALPTGCILYDTRLFRDLFDPTKRYRQLRDLGLTSSEAARAAGSWFEYEYENEFCAQKGSTEDVYNTRDISLAGIQKYGANPVHCNWDAWAGHWKPKLVRKPQILTADSVSRSLADVVLRGNESGTRIEKVDFSGGKIADTMTESPAEPTVLPTDTTPNSSLVYPAFCATNQSFRSDIDIFGPTWKHYLSVIPGVANSGALMVAVSKADGTVVIYDESAKCNASAEDLTSDLATKAKGRLFDETLIEGHSGRTTVTGYNKTVASIYSEAFRNHNVGTAPLKCHFVDNIAAIQAVRKLIDNQMLYVVRDKTVGFQLQMEKYRFSVTNGNPSPSCPLVSCLELLVHYLASPTTIVTSERDDGLPSSHSEELPRHTQVF